MEIKTGDFAADICRKMVDIVTVEQNERLRNVIFHALHERQIIKEDAELIPFEPKSNEWYLDRFILDKRVSGCTERTLSSYRASLELALRKMNKNAVEITADDIIAYIAIRDMSGKVNKVTLRSEYLRLSTFYAWMARCEFVLRNPMLKVPPIKRRKQKKQAFTDMELEKIRGACESTRETAIIELLLSTGCRISELSALKISDVLRKEKCTILGKGMKERTVYLNARAQLSVEKYVSERTDNNPFLFPRAIDPITSAVISRIKGLGKSWYKEKWAVAQEGHSPSQVIGVIIKEIGERAGLPKGECYPHKFRRTCATIALRRGMPLIQVSRMLGHADVSTTQIYLDLNDDELKQAHQKYVC